MAKPWTCTSQPKPEVERAYTKLIFVKNKEAVDRVQILQFETLEEEKGVKVDLRVVLDFERDHFNSFFFQDAGGCFTS